MGILSFILDLPLFILFLFFIGGLYLPYLYLINKRKKRLSLLSYQLIETLGMMANSLRAGFSFMQAMQLTGRELPDPLGPEFDRAVREVGLGKPIEEVFESLVNRLPNKELEVVIRAILAQRKSGGNLAELLETMEETIRGRVRILDELKTLTAQGKMSAWVITLIPPGLAVYLYVVNPEYFKPMLNHPLGVLMLSIGSISIILGWLLIQKIIKIEV
jgi:tight adherence protein B